MTVEDSTTTTPFKIKAENNPIAAVFFCKVLLSSWSFLCTSSIIAFNESNYSSASFGIYKHSLNINTEDIRFIKYHHLVHPYNI